MPLFVITAPDVVARRREGIISYYTHTDLTDLTDFLITFGDSLHYRHLRQWPAAIYL